MGGATARHSEGMEIKEIMHLGRWTDLTVNTYLRPELLEPPQELKKNKDYLTKRKYRRHIFCSCKEGSEASKKADHIMRVDRKCPAKLKKLPDTQIQNL